MIQGCGVVAARLPTRRPWREPCPARGSAAGVWRTFLKRQEYEHMNTRTTSAGLAALLLVAACTDAVGPARHAPDAPRFATQAPGTTGIVLDQMNGTLRESGTMLIKGFNPTNPHNGDAIVVTFSWLGSTNTIDSVTDVLTTTPYTPVGNKYTLVSYVTAGGISMATYVATNVQNFPDAYSDPAGTYILAVRANFSAPVSGGILMSAWSGVNTVAAQALGASSKASGSGATPTVADPGPVAVGAGALAYAMTLSNGLVDHTPPSSYTILAEQSDASQGLVGEAVYTVPASTGSLDPQWTWYFNSPSTWLATALVLNPAAAPPPPTAATQLAFTVQPSDALVNGVISPAVQVTAQDGAGSTVPSFSGAIRVALGTNPSSALLSGTKTVTAVSGVATFSDLSINKIGNGYALQATASGLTGATSAAITITARLAFTVQ